MIEQLQRETLCEAIIQIQLNTALQSNTAAKVSGHCADKSTRTQLRAPSQLKLIADILK